MKKPPVNIVKEKFESKEKLMKELKVLFDKGELFENNLNPEKGLKHVSNAKLLKLHNTATEVQERFSTRAKMIDDLLKIMNKEKDAALKEKLARYGLPRLLDMYKTKSKKLA